VRLKNRIAAAVIAFAVSSGPSAAEQREPRPSTATNFLSILQERCPSLASVLEQQILEELGEHSEAESETAGPDIIGQVSASDDVVGICR
jgi:hypothetical protein